MAEYEALFLPEEKAIVHIALSAGIPFAYFQCYSNADWFVYRKWRRHDVAEPTKAYI